jgi:hypothetical protein
MTHERTFQVMAWALKLTPVAAALFALGSR